MAYKKVNDNSLTNLANAIRAKAGIANSLKFPEDFMSAIKSISAASLPVLANQAQSGDILSGKSAYDSAGNEVQGGIVTQSGSGNTALTAAATSKSYPAGYYPNAHGAQVSVEQKTGLTLNTLPFNIAASAGKLMSSAQISALGGEIYKVRTGAWTGGSSARRFVVENIGFAPVGAVLLMQKYGSKNNVLIGAASWSSVDEGYCTIRVGNQTSVKSGIYTSAQKKDNNLLAGNSDEQIFKTPIQLLSDSVYLDLDEMNASSSYAFYGSYIYIIWGR